MKSFEMPKDSQRNNYESAYEDVLSIAQKLSHQWQELMDKVKSDPDALAGNPTLQEIYGYNNPPKSGIQSYFEGQMKFIEESSGGDENTKNIMLYRLKQDLERMEEKVNDIIGQ